MLLSKALFTAGMYLKDGTLYELGGHVSYTEDALKIVLLKQRQILHDLYISPSDTKTTNEHIRYHDAVETIVEFMSIKPTLDALGISYTENLRQN